MITMLLGFKQKQTQEFTGLGRRVPVTEISVGPCYVTAIDARTVQLGIGTLTHISKAETGHLKKAGLTQKLRFLRSFPVPVDAEGLTAGTELNAGKIFTVGDTVSVVGVSKGKGFAGVVKRHHFRGGPRTHGQSDRERSPGSIGATTTPGRVFRGKRMAGRMGTDRVTVRGLSVVHIDSEKQTIRVKGLVPGGKNGLLIISKE